jgi:N-acetylglutamate synthase-like GNAT family acetyltransferase
MVIAQTFG